LGCLPLQVLPVKTTQEKNKFSKLNAADGLSSVRNITP
jgi:hypothetical protein